MSDHLAHRPNVVAKHYMANTHVMTKMGKNLVFEMKKDCLNRTSKMITKVSLNSTHAIVLNLYINASLTIEKHRYQIVRGEKSPKTSSGTITNQTFRLIGL